MGQRLLSIWSGLDARRAERARRERYQRLFASPLGREVLADMIMSSGYVAQPNFEDGPKQNFLQGARWWMGEILRLAQITERDLADAIIEDDIGTDDHG